MMNKTKKKKKKWVWFWVTVWGDGLREKKQGGWRKIVYSFIVIG